MKLYVLRLIDVDLDELLAVCDSYLTAQTIMADLVKYKVHCGAEAYYIISEIDINKYYNYDSLYNSEIERYYL